MLRSSYEILKQYYRGVLLLGIILCFILLVQDAYSDEIQITPSTTASNSAASILSRAKSSSVDPTDGKLDGSAYKSSDPSAIGGYKITFGKPNKVSFSKLSYMTSQVVISTGSLLNARPISPFDYGADVIWYDGGYGVQNPANNQLYSGVVSQAKTIGVSMLRYPGGIPSDTFHWQDAIGPQDLRTNNVVYQSKDVFFPSNFGPDEFGKLLQKTNSVGDITVNFGTGSAQEAADWVQYMTASPTSNVWGELRAKNGHSAPYDIPYWEVGNEQQASSGENYWRAGSVVKVGSFNGQCASNDVRLCEYVYGGITAFSNQKTIGANNLKTGNGTPNQAFYALYPPIVQASQSVYVNGQLWHEVSNITNAAQGELAYQLNDSTGKILFGDGTYGSVLPVGAQVTISYQSGPHDGFIEYYKLMKAADPAAQICSSYDQTDFIQLMGATNPYDCLVSHLYGGKIPSTNDSSALFHNSLIEQSNKFARAINIDQTAIDKYAGARAKNINLAVTEYGVNALTSPAGIPNYHRSQDMALFIANTLKVLIDAHIPVAEKHYLISYQDESPGGTRTYINGNTFSNNALIAGPGSDSVLQPSAYALQAYTKYLYPNLISSSVKNNPLSVYSSGSYPSLSTVATTDNKGNEALMVINLSDYTSVKAEIKASLSSYRKIQSWTLGANSFLAYNTRSDPYVVGFAKTSGFISSGQAEATFPPSSITVIQFIK